MVGENEQKNCVSQALCFCDSQNFPFQACFTLGASRVVLRLCQRELQRLCQGTHGDCVHCQTDLGVQQLTLENFGVFHVGRRRRYFS